ncbi:hypothetical protein KP509_07G090200 [Ceratopteris richardii]|uniref:Cyclin N-terminal domain-containing protein n=1 Tax=Ceratopteris richardii TaxID=49495 RepID=A0A8T2UC76_CERRI|nr:hypothetical protein KP509_07G090200 [Ceratopteris richardii]
MAPSVDCSAASLLCCEESGCFSDGDGQEREECSVLRNEIPSSYITNRLADPCDMEVAISALVEREVHHLPRKDYLDNYKSKVLEVDSRMRAITWILKVRAFYNFTPLTAALSVNYLDRFLACHIFPNGKSWMVQLLSVACLSLAAKMEEVDVPFLLELQVGTELFFEPRTIQRMELLVLSTLEWRMSSVTPFAYVHYFVSKLDLDDCSNCIFLSRVNELILSTLQDLSFTSFRPSSIAIAAVLCAVQELVPLQLTDFKAILLSMIPTQLQDSSQKCFMLMIEKYLTPFHATSKEESYANAVPQSPAGVLDASFSCDTESTFKSVGSNCQSNHISPVPKKRKLDRFSSCALKAYTTE